MQRGFEEVKEALRSRKELIESDGVELLFNGLGEVVDIDIKDEKLKGDWEKLRLVLIDLINRAQDRSRDMLREELSRKFGGFVGGSGFGF